MKLVKNNKRGNWETDDGETIAQAIKKINLRLEGYDRLLIERNALDIQCQNRAITIVNLNKVIAELRNNNVV